MCTKTFKNVRKDRLHLREDESTPGQMATCRRPMDHRDIGHQHLRPHQPVYAYSHRPFPVPERYMRRKVTAESSSAWWYRRYRCGHHLRDRRKLFPPQSQISSRSSTTAESVGFWNSRYQHYPSNVIFTNGQQTRCSNSSAYHPERDSTR